MSKVVKTPWEWCKKITNTKENWDTFDEASQKKFSVYMVNRFISMNSNFIDLVNEVQKLGLKSRETYKVYSELIPKSNYYFKWMKGKKTRDKLNESWVIDLLCKHYEASKKEVDTYIDLLLNSDSGKEELFSIFDTYGIDKKLVKKLKI